KGQVKINGELAKDVEVVVTGDAEQTVQTNDHGKFEFTELSPGKYTVSVNYEESEADISPIEIEITDRDKVNINFDITSDEKKEEKTKKESLIKSEDSKEDEGMPTYLKSSDLMSDSFLVLDRKSTRLNSSHVSISYAVF